MPSLAAIAPLHAALKSGDVVACDTGMGVCLFIPRAQYDVALNWRGYHLAVSTPRADNDPKPFAVAPVQP